MKLQPLLALLFLCACGPKSIYEQYSKNGLSDLIWDRSELQSFEITPPDTVNAYQLVLLIRHTSRIPYKSLSIGMVLADENKIPKYIQQYEFMFRDPNTGMFVGEVMGDLGDTEQVLEKEFRFKSLGKHTIAFVHGLNDEGKAKEIMELGLILRQVQQ